MEQATAIASAVWGVLLTFPETVWTALMGSGFTLLGVIIANRHSRRQLKMQLAADAAEKAKQRLADMRKAVYLGAADELVKANTVIAALPQTDLSTVNPSLELKGFFASMMKLQLVGDPKTAQLASSLVSSYGEVLGRTMVQVMPIRNAVSDLEIQTGLYEGHQSEIKRIIAEMTAMNESGKPDFSGFDAKNRSLEFHKAQAAKIEQERQRLRAVHSSLQLAFMRSVPGTMKALMAELLPLLLELRRELDTGGSYDEFKWMLDAQAQRMEAILGRVASAIDSDSKGTDAA